MHGMHAWKQAAERHEGTSSLVHNGQLYRGNSVRNAVR